METFLIKYVLCSGIFLKYFHISERKNKSKVVFPLTNMKHWFCADFCPVLWSCFRSHNFVKRLVDFYIIYIIYHELILRWFEMCINNLKGLFFMLQLVFYFLFLWQSSHGSGLVQLSILTDGGSKSPSFSETPCAHAWMSGKRILSSTWRRP